MLSTLSLQSNASGYVPTPFPGKEKQFDLVLDELDRAGFIPEALIESETRWFYEQLGIDDVFFARESVAGIAGHIHALYAAKLEQYAAGNSVPVIHLAREEEDHAVYFTLTKGFEERIDERYLNSSSKEKLYRVELFRAPLGKDHIRLHFVYRTQFPENKATDLSGLAAYDDLGALDAFSDSTFSKIALPHTKNLYARILSETPSTMGPVIHHYDVDGSKEHRLVIAFHQNTSTNYCSALSALLSYYKLTETRRYVEQFLCGVTVVSLYIEADASAHPALLVQQVVKEASLLYCLPNNDFASFFRDSSLLLQESIYAHCGAIFVTHFLNRLGPEYAAVAKLVGPQGLEALSALKKRLRAETYTPEFIRDVFGKQLPLVGRLYRHFADTHYIGAEGQQRTLSYQRLQETPLVDSDSHFELLLAHSTQDERAVLVMRALYAFNKSVLKTNFYTNPKVAILFRLEPSFLPKDEYPETPFGMFFVVGADFRGFHIRFRDIARGGIRVVRSRNEDAYSANSRSLIDENYGLASTQQRKNKDIPEGGSKGVILLNPGTAQKRPRGSFEKYIDAILDILLDKGSMIDLYKKPEILFMGPDEGTADYVDWATLHARRRGAPWWKSFFTGKSPSLGGIPHDVYGMTTLSVRTYVEEIYKKLGLENKRVTKFQTGGPGGDLGLNEILLSTPNEVYVAVVDGPAVVGDPNGLDKNELIRLAKARLDILYYDPLKLSKDGYLVKVDDVDVVTPGGVTAPNGVVFRNTFHLRIKELFGKVDVFVPCGGRPALVDANSVHSLIEDGKSIIPYIVEGANLFFTQAAKLALEAAGAILFKDALTNKGGVTLSSREVLASLAMEEKVFLEKMCVKGDTLPEFYQAYVRDVQSFVKEKARLEFHALWKIKEKTGKPFSELSDELLVAINELADLLAGLAIWEEDPAFRDAVLQQSLPKILLNEIGGVKGLLGRAPEAYLRRVFSTQIAGGFVYERGVDGGPAAFLEYVGQLRKSFNLK